VDCKGKFSSQKVGRSGAQLPQFTRNPPKGWIAQKLGAGRKAQIAPKMQQKM
jgi:hypothetical protein